MPDSYDFQSPLHQSSGRSHLTGPETDRDRHRRPKRHRHSPFFTRDTVTLPYKAKPLSKRDYDLYRPLFASYLDIQKHIYLEDLNEREAQGRWKSFVGHWNRGDLARSWYDPSILKTAQEAVQPSHARKSREETRMTPDYTARHPEPQDQSDDDFGPAPPSHVARTLGLGPAMPRMDDLTFRDESLNDDQNRERVQRHDELRYERKMERKEQKNRLDELVPHADPGSRERHLEKKRGTTNTLQSFRDAKEGGEVEVGEADLMGDDGEALRRQRKETERHKNEREIRREEVARARAAEWEERLAERREKEDKTMEFLKQIAKERYG